MDIAVLLPCHDEALTVGETVAGFRRSLPDARIVVCDNASTDGTAEAAAAAGAEVLVEPTRGKGAAVRRLFSEVTADVYVLADGDATYDAAAAPAMVDRLVGGNLDMIIGARLDDAAPEAFRPGHRLGNRLLSKTVQTVFGARVDDLLSGYRVMSNRFVKTFPAESRGFEVETELTVYALESRLPTVEMPVGFKARPAGSHSKLATWSDGLRILLTILHLLRDLRPFRFFLLLCLAALVADAVLSYPIILTYLQTGQVPRIPTVVLIVGLFVLSMVFLTCGIILDRVNATRRLMSRLHYLQMPGPGA